MLKTEGVPEGQAKARTSAAIQALGAGRLHTHGKSPWKEMKALANQATPPVFQFVLPSELELGTKAKSADGRPSPRSGSYVSRPLLLSSSRKQHACRLWTPCASWQGSFVGDLEHLPPSSVGPSAKHIVLLAAEDAYPYTQVPKPVSSSALGLLAPGPHEVEGSKLQGTQLRFTARLLATSTACSLSLPAWVL